MPKISTGLTGSLRVSYDALAADDLYAYSSLTLQEDVEDAVQLTVRWETISVTRQSDGAVLNPNFDLTAVVARQIYTLDGSLYTVNSASKTILIDDTAIAGTSVVVDGETYVRGVVAVNSASPFVIERATDVTNPIVEYQPGSRLSHETLNASADQEIYAIQELTQEVFELQGLVGTVDLANNGIGDLGNVELVALEDNDILAYDFATGLWKNQSAVEVDITLNELSDVEAPAPTDGQAIVWSTANSRWETGRAGATALDLLDDVYIPNPPNVGDFLRHDGSNWVNEVVDFSSTVADLTDTDVTGLVDQQVLRYDAASGNWLPSNDLETDFRTAELIDYAFFLNRPLTNPTSATMNLLDTSQWEAGYAESWANARWSDNIAAGGTLLEGGTGRVWTAPADMKLDITIGWMVRTQEEAIRARVVKNGAIVWSAGVYEDADPNTTEDLFITQAQHWGVEVTAGDTLELHIMPGSSTAGPVGTVELSRVYYKVREVNTSYVLLDGGTQVTPHWGTVGANGNPSVRILTPPTVAGTNTDMSVVDPTAANVRTFGDAEVLSAWDYASGVWTCPEAGRYRMEWAVAASPDATGTFNPYLAAEINGAYEGSATYSYNDNVSELSGSYHSNFPMRDEIIRDLEVGDTLRPILGTGQVGGVDIRLRYWEVRIHRLDFDATIEVDGVNLSQATIRPDALEADRVAVGSTWAAHANTTVSPELTANTASINEIYLNADDSYMVGKAARASTGSDGRTIAAEDVAFNWNPFGYLYLYDTARQGTSKNALDDHILFNPKRAPSSVDATDTKIQVTTGGRTGFQYYVNGFQNKDILDVRRTQGNNDDFVRIQPSNMSASAENTIYSYDQSSAANRFYVRGSGAVYGRSFNLTSDARKKDYSVTEAVPASISDAFASLETLDTYVWNDTDGDDTQVLYGPTAQDLMAKGLSVMIDQTPDSEGDVLLQVNTSSALGLLMQAVKELTEQNAALTSRIEALEGGA